MSRLVRLCVARWTADDRFALAGLPASASASLCATCASAANWRGGHQCRRHGARPAGGALVRDTTTGARSRGSSRLVQHTAVRQEGRVGRRSLARSKRVSPATRVQTPDELLDTELAGAPQARQVRAPISPRLLRRGWSRLVDINGIAATQGRTGLGRCYRVHTGCRCRLRQRRATAGSRGLPALLGRRRCSVGACCRGRQPRCRSHRGRRRPARATGRSRLEPRGGRRLVPRVAHPLVPKSRR